MLQNWGLGLYIPCKCYVYMYIYPDILSNPFQSDKPFARRATEIGFECHIWLVYRISLEILTNFHVNNIFLAQILTELQYFIRMTWKKYLFIFLDSFCIVCPSISFLTGTALMHFIPLFWELKIEGNLVWKVKCVIFDDPIPKFDFENVSHL